MNTQSHYKAVIFDLDGTLLDSLADLADSTNAILHLHGFEVHPLDAYRYFVGDGMQNLILRALPPDTATPALAHSLLPEVSAEYDVRWHNKTKPYPGIMPMLEQFLSRGTPMSVLSNKPHPFTTQIVSHFFAEIPFAKVYGSREGIPRKPDPAAALDIASQLKIMPSEFLYLGDTNTDMHTALSAGMFAVGASWGFRPVKELVDSGAAAVIDHPEELLSF